MIKLHFLVFACLLNLCVALSNCYAQVGKAKNRISSIYINTPDSSVKATITDQPEKHPQNERMYHWYAANQVCYSKGAYSGKLLHGVYSSFYPNHFLLAQGQFRFGLKDGCWKRWLPDGSLYEVTHYKNGLRHGTHEIYSPNGQLRKRIYYRKGVLDGKTTIFSQDGKDSVILYRKGVPVLKKDRRSEIGDGKSDDRKNDSVKKDRRSETGDGKRDGRKNDSVKKDGRSKIGNRSKDSVRKDSSQNKSPREHKLKWLFRGDSTPTPVPDLPTPNSK